MKKINIYKILLLLVGVLFVNSCDEIEEYPETRLFRPVLNSELTARNNTILVDMAKMTDAVSYKIEISRDDFATVLKTYNSTSNRGIIPDLLWNTEYQVRATAIAATPEFNSRPSELGSVTTARFPTILQIPTADDVTDVAAKVRWQTGAGTGAAITQVKVFAIDDEALLTPLFTYPVSSTEQAAGEKIIYGLNPSTEYQLAIYSEDNVRGWDKYKTLDAISVDGNVVDLRGIVPTTTTLYDALTNAAAGATVILDGDQKYTMTTTYFFDKALTIKSGYSINNTTGAIIDTSVSGDFGLAASGAISSIVFDGVSLTGTTARYVINVATSVSTTVDEIKFVNCKITSYRDMLRTRPQWTSGGIKLFTIDNCIVTDISSNGLIIVDVTTLHNPVPDVTFKNSTFSKVAKLMNNRATKDSNTLFISNCTFCESPKAAPLLEYTNTSNVLQGIVIENSIFGRGGDNVGNYSNPFVKSGNLPATAINSTNVFKTNDYTFTAPIAPATTPNPVFTVYSNTTDALWVAPFIGDFNIKDSAFSGAKSAGDPRWRKK